MPGIELRLLGGFELRRPDGGPITIAPRKVRALLSFLGVNLGKPVAREALSTLIWGDVSADEQARRSLRQALTTLRRELPDGALDARRDSIMLHPTAGVDVPRFEHDALQTDRASLEQALKLYRGDLLEGFSGRATDFDAWVERERKRLQTLAADAMQRLCELQREGGDAAAAMATAMRLVAFDPLRESAHRALMELYAEAGRASEAVRQFNLLRAVLAEKLGAQPDAQTAALLERIRGSSERRQVPAPAASLLPAGTPELREVCVLAVALSDGSFDAALERDVEVTIARFGGSLTRVSEQRALGVFGFPRAHDNDLERSVRAALSLTRLERLSKGVTIGVSSGPLLVEDQAEKPVLRGDVLRAAAELSQQRERGVVLSNAIARALGERVELAPGEDTSGSRCVLRFLDTAKTSGREGLVGRRHELAQLTSALELCEQTGRGRTLLLRGEAGIGKTRLSRALSEAARERGFAVHARSLIDFGDDAQGSPVQGVVRELMAEEGGDQAGAPRADSLDETELSVLLELVREVSQDRVGRELGDRALYLRRRRAAACKLLALRSRQKPRLVWIDDIHWADAETLAQLRAWVDTAASHPVLLLLTTRLDEMEASPLRDLTRGRPVTTVDLAPLANEEVRELIRALGPEDEQGAEAVLLRSGGNPLFVEQLLRCAEPLRVPSGISSLVQARLDQLEPEQRAVLQAAAVLGRYFTVPALSYLVEQDELPLGPLVEQSLIAEQADSFAFVHALLRDAVYHGVPRERRVRLHAGAARYYAGRDAALHAEHLACAGDDAAAAAYLRAATAERRGGNSERALELCLRSRELATRGQERHASALFLGELLVELGRSEAALEAFAAAETSAANAGERARAHLGRAAALRVLDRAKEALLELAAAERLLDPARDSMLLSQVHYLRGNVLFPLGDWAACLESQTLALAAARRTGSALAEAQALSGMGDAHFLAGRWRKAHECFARCEAAARQIGALDLELTSAGMKHNIAVYELAFHGSAAGSREVAERARSSGSLRAEALSRVSAAWSFLALGDWEAARTEADRAVSVADGIGARRFSALGLAYGAIAKSRLGELETARSELHRARALAEASSLNFAGIAVYAALLVTSERSQLPRLLDEAEAVIEAGCMNLALVVFTQHGLEAALEIGDVARATRYADALDASMREEPHALGALFVSYGRALCAFQRDPSSERARRELGRLRDELQRASMRPTAEHIDRLLSGRAEPASVARSRTLS